jgi:hypothetical protein
MGLFRTDVWGDMAEALRSLLAGVGLSRSAPAAAGVRAVVLIRNSLKLLICPSMCSGAQSDVAPGARRASAGSLP